MDGRSVDGSSIESDRSRFFPDQASGEFREHEPQKEPKAGFLPVVDGKVTVDLLQGEELVLQF